MVSTKLTNVTQMARFLIRACQKGASRAEKWAAEYLNSRN